MSNISPIDGLKPKQYFNLMNKASTLKGRSVRRSSGFILCVKKIFYLIRLFFIRLGHLMAHGKYETNHTLMKHLHKASKESNIEFGKKIQIEKIYNRLATCYPKAQSLQINFKNEFEIKTKKRSLPYLDLEIKTPKEKPALDSLDLAVTKKPLIDDPFEGVTSMAELSDDEDNYELALQNLEEIEVKQLFNRCCFIKKQFESRKEVTLREYFLHLRECQLFITQLTEMQKKYGRDEDLEDIHTKVMDFKKIFESFCEQIELRLVEIIHNQYKTVDNKGRGDCMYLSIIGQISRIDPSKKGEEAAHYRKLAANYIREKLDKLKIAIRDAINNDPYIPNSISNEEYPDLIENSHTWGGQLEMQALSEVLQYPIIQFWDHPHKKGKFELNQIYNLELLNKKSPILIYYNGTSHYMELVHIQSARPSFSTV